MRKRAMATKNPDTNQPLGERYPGLFIGFAVVLIVTAESLVEWLL